MTTVSPVMGAVDDTRQGGELHSVMAYIKSTWPNFCLRETAQQKKLIMVAWENKMHGYPLSLLKAAIDACAKANPKYPPNSAEVITARCDQIQRPMDALDAKWYADMAELGIMDADFCAKQIAKYRAAKAAGRNAYAGWD